MTPERWRRVEAVFHSALERGPAERAAFLAGACAGDEALLAEVERLIAAHEKEGSFIDSPAYADTELRIDTQAALTAGQRLGPYRVITHIGSGGMGEVYLAEDVRLGRKAALKLLRAEFTRDEDRLRRFQLEARAASALNHPNILTIYEIGSEDGMHFMATEYIEGETLRRHMAGGAVKLGKALDVALQVASALAAAHEAGIVHRDVKPENVMVRRDGYAKVLDFGLAKLTERAAAAGGSAVPTLVKVETNPGVVMGTPHYMSPEQARGLGVDARTDIFSLGVVLYEMVAGRAPFTGATATDVILSIVEREPAPLAHHAGEVPAELQRMVTKALAKDREKRYQTVKDLLIDLKNLRDELEFEARLERSAPPEVGREAGARSGRAEVAALTGPAARPTSSAEYLVTGIKRHGRVAALTLAALAVAVAAATYFYFVRGGGGTIDSMAVLPFVNDGADPDTEYLSDGITESLTNSLSQIPNLRMIARTSAQRYKGRETDPQAAARELGVQGVLTGRVVRRGDQLAVSAELVDARDNSHVWGERYDRRLSDVLAVQQEIAREIAGRLRARLTGEERRRVTRNYTENVEAYQLYLRGGYHLNKRTAEGLRQAIEYFQQAIDRDPNYALAYSGLSECYSSLHGGGALASEMLPRARAAALRALEIDDSLAEAHASLGRNYYQSWQWAEAERELKRAIELNPNYASAHAWYSNWLEIMGRSDEALRASRRAQELDPLSPNINLIHARNYLMRGELDAALNGGRKVVELSPDYHDGHMLLAHVYLKQERHEEAITEFQKAVELRGRGSAQLAQLGYGYAVAGRRSEALAILRELENRLTRREVRGAWIAWIYAGLGDKDQAFAWLERDFQERVQERAGMLTNAIFFYPSLDTLRSDPRYRDLLRRMGLPQ